MVMHIRDLVKNSDDLICIPGCCFDRQFHSYIVCLYAVKRLIHLLPFRFLRMEQIPTHMWKPTCFLIHTRLPNARQRSRGKPGTLLSMRWLGNTKKWLPTFIYLIYIFLNSRRMVHSANWFIQSFPPLPPQLVYSGYSKETLGLRELQLSVLSAESLRENYFLGGITLRLKDFDLSKETVKWYKLTAVPYF